MFTSWFSSSNPERDQERLLNTQVKNANDNVQALQVQRAHLIGKKEDLLNEISAADEDGREDEKEALFAEYQQVESELQDLEGILNNVRVTSGALKNAATIKSVYDTQLGASEALKVVNQQVREDDIVRVNSQLEERMRQTQGVSKAMTKPLKTRQQTKTKDVNALLADRKARKIPEIRQDEQKKDSIKNQEQILK